MINKKRYFKQIPHTVLYILYSAEPYPEVFVDDIEQMVYMFSHYGEKGPIYFGLDYGGEDE